MSSVLLILAICNHSFLLNGTLVYDREYYKYTCGSLKKQAK
jgi:hypothetical protein